MLLKLKYILIKKRVICRKGFKSQFLTETLLSINTLLNCLLTKNTMAGLIKINITKIGVSKAIERKIHFFGCKI